MTEGIGVINVPAHFTLFIPDHGDKTERIIIIISA